MEHTTATDEPTPPVRQWRPVARGAVTLPRAEGAEQQLSQRTEAVRLRLLADTRKRWGAKARQAKNERSYHYAANRAAALARPLTPRLQACGTVGMDIACRCGPRVLWRGCRQWWVCARCRARRFAPMRERLQDSLRVHVERGERGGRRVGLRLLTLSLRTTGDVPRDRADLGAAWRAFYQAMHRWLGRHAYAGVYEVTPGTEGKGHVHMHVAVVWPRWVDYGRVRSLWLRASHGKSTRISIVGGSNDGAGAARYLSKYLSKGCDSREYTPELQGAVLAAFYNQRAVTACRGFWTPKPVCAHCGEHAHPVNLLARPRAAGCTLVADDLRGGPAADRDDWPPGRQRGFPVDERAGACPS